MLPVLRRHVVEFPVWHMRGGTSTGVVLLQELMPSEPKLRDELIRHIMGVPLHGPVPHNTQVNGLGRGLATSNKVFLVSKDEKKSLERKQLVLTSTLAQLAV